MPGKAAGPRFDAAAIRRAAQLAVDETSLRAVAEEIGISKSGLDSFLRGRNPYSRTRVRLAGWYFRRRARQPTVAREDVDAALAVIELYMNAAGTEVARARRVREVVSRLTGSAQRGTDPDSAR